MEKERYEKRLSTNNDQDMIKKDALLSLYGSIPSREASAQKDWDDIRKKARSERFHSNNDSTQ